MTYYNEATLAAQISNSYIAAEGGDFDAAFTFLSSALDCSDRSSSDLLAIDTTYDNIKELEAL